MSRDDDVERAHDLLKRLHVYSTASVVRVAADLIAEVRAEAFEAAAARVESLAKPERPHAPLRSLINGAFYTAAIEVRALAKESAK